MERVNARADRGHWQHLADGVYARRYAELDQTLGLILGEHRALVVDTGRDEMHGAEFAAAVRELTPLPCTVVITHAHFDHCLGTAAFPRGEVWAHANCRIDARLFEERAEYYPEPIKVRLVAPTHRVHDRASLDLGGHEVHLVHPGRGHTDHDLVVHVPDAGIGGWAPRRGGWERHRGRALGEGGGKGIVFAGDLVERGAPPSIGVDAFPAEWPRTLDAVLALDPTVVVPGHGEPVDAEFVRNQRAELAGPA